MQGERQEVLPHVSRYSKFKSSVKNALRVDQSDRGYWLYEFIRPVLDIKYELGIGAWAFALGFTRYFNHTVLFPAFPNELDAIGMAGIGTYLFYSLIKDVKRREDEEKAKHPEREMIRRAARNRSQARLDAFLEKNNKRTGESVSRE